MATTTSPSPTPGILYVNSDVLPSKLTSLSRSDFDFWYIDDHIPDVLSRSGVSGATRWNQISPPSSSAENTSSDVTESQRKLKFLTIYDFNDIHYMKSPEFMSLEGVVPGPNRWTIFENAVFDTRVCELVQVDERKIANKNDHPTLLLHASIVHQSPHLLDEWYREEHVRLISQCPGYHRTRRYKLVSRSILSSFERTILQEETEAKEEVTWIALHEFDGEELPREELRATDETEWAKKVLKGVKSVEWGAFRLSKVFKKDGEEGREKRGGRARL